MKRVMVRFKAAASFMGRLYEKGQDADALRVPKKTKEELSCYLILGSAGVFSVTAELVEELPEPEL